MVDDVISIMISSRNAVPIEIGGKPSTLTVLRRKLKEKIQAYQPFGQPLFDVWINEDEAEDASADPWEHSQRRVRASDLILVLYNGDPGWDGAGTIGICHAELQEALNTQSGKVFAIGLPLANLPKKKAERERHQRFREYWNARGMWSPPAKNGDEVLQRIGDLLHKAITSMVGLGVRQAGKGRFASGDALEWSRLDFELRKQQIEETLCDAIRIGESGAAIDERSLVVSGMFLRIHAVPGAMATAAAREMVGRPFHHDHRDARHLAAERAAGPVHVIGCHKGVTEAQAMTLLGRPDVTTVTADFGLLAVDQISKVQCLLVRDCRDETTTRNGIATAFRWLRSSNEWRLLLERARSRAKIVQAIARELS